jgi:hypothetical protein
VLHLKIRGQDNIPVILLAMILILTMFYGMNYSTSFNLPSLRGERNQPDQSFKQYIWGGLGGQVYCRYGWNSTYIANFNGDNNPDLIIGAPGYDSSSFSDVGMVYIFYGTDNPVFNNINYSQADVKIRGDGLNDRFGWDVADAGDMNNDGVNDLIVGAPGALNNRGSAYIFYGGAGLSGEVIATNVADRILTGLTIGGRYGSAVSGAGDIDNDDYDDVVIGSPGSDESVIIFGYDKLVKIYPNIWDDNPNTPSIIDFNQGVNNTNNDTNTWGRLAGDDGWDWIDGISDTTDGVYGHHVSTPTHGTTIDLADCYGPWEPDGPDGDNLTRDNRSALQVIAGRTRETSNPYGPSGSDDPMTSAAWGIEFNITSEMMDYLSTNSTIKVSFSYESWDNEKVFNTPTTAGTEELCTVRSRIWNSSGKYYLGDIIKNNDRYIFYHYQEFGTPEWSTVFGNFKYDISPYIDGAGTYYWDFGCSFGYWDTDQNNNDPDEGILTYFDDVSMVITNERSVTIEGMQASGFGTALTNVGDINDDGYSDLLVGAPNLDSGYAVLFTGKKRYNIRESINLANIILTGTEAGDKFGYSVASAGDVDNDGLQDIIIGAPGGNYANLYYASTLNSAPLLPNLWENAEEQSTPQIEFNSGLKTTGNSEGIDGEDDGWDTWDGVYGHSGTAGSSVKYNGANNPNPTQVAIDDKLLIGIGAHYGNSAKPDSGAYGVEFSVTQDMIDAITAGGEAVLSYDWYFENHELESDETVWMKTTISNSGNDFDLGWNLDASASGNNKDQTNEIFWSDAPEDMHDVFIQKCSTIFSNQGSYYLDLGGKLRAWTSSSTNHEDGLFHFDNIHLRINRPADKQFLGPTGSGFGSSVGYSDKLNIDDYGDIIIGAPNYDSPFGENSGAVFGFMSDPSSPKQILAEHAEFFTYGEHPNDKLGWSLTTLESLDSDEFNEIVTSAIGYDSTVMDVGRVYIFSITKKPRIRLIHPVGGEVLSGNVTVNATIVDPDDNIDINYGVRFYYSTDLTDWTHFGTVRTQPQSGNIFEHFWDTTMVPDDTNYYVRSWVRDLKLNFGENTSSAITIDNPHPPKLKILNPSIGETVAGVLDIKALVKDSELDNIGGGINTTKGVKFYLSQDKTSWEILSSVKKGVQDVYNISLATEKYPDGEYWLKINATDWDGFEVEEIINITIDNPSRPPSVELVKPLPAAELVGTVDIIATAIDLDGDLNSSGVTFCIFSSREDQAWQVIGNDPKPEVNSTGANIFTFSWDTTSVNDNWYLLKAIVSDNEKLSNESAITEVKVHNNDKNPPVIELTIPKGGEILKETQMLSARVRDLEDNIDSHGVDYYYSIDRVQWRLIGTTATPRTADPEFYDLLWQTSTIPDGEYWLNVTVSDETQLSSWDALNEPIFIHNSILNAPLIKFIAPIRGQHINDTFSVQVSANDLENNINSDGVFFYYSTDNSDWTAISNVPKPLATDSTIYELSWDTTIHPDGKYWLRAEATDFDQLLGGGDSDYFFIHNSIENPPEVIFLGPNSGKVSGNIKVNSSVFDIENNLNDNGVSFFYSTDNQTWQRISNDPSGIPYGIEESYFEITWDTTRVPDDLYWLRAEAVDETGLIGSDISDNRIIVHNKLTNPPRVTLKQPRKGVPLSRVTAITVEVIDFDDDIELVGFYYSSDNETWTLIDTSYKANKGDIYRIMWNTEKLYNGEYYLMVRASDKMGNNGEVWAGPFEVSEGRSREGDDSEDFFSSINNWIIIIIVSIIIIVLIFAVFLKRSKRREKELIEEVSTEMRKTMAVEGEGEMPPGSGADLTVPDQTYVPSSLGIEIPGTGLSPTPGAAELEIPSPEVEAIDTTPSSDPSLGTTPPGSTPELSQIDDMMPQLLPGDTAPEAETGPEVRTEEPPPADIDLPPETQPVQPSMPETSEVDTETIPEQKTETNDEVMDKKAEESEDQQ